MFIEFIDYYIFLSFALLSFINLNFRAIKAGRYFRWRAYFPPQIHSVNKDECAKLPPFVTAKETFLIGDASLERVYSHATRITLKGQHLMHARTAGHGRLPPYSRYIFCEMNRSFFALACFSFSLSLSLNE